MNTLFSARHKINFDNIRCDYIDCPNLTCAVVKLADLPDNIVGKVRPSYDVWIKLCGSHGVRNVIMDQLEFVVQRPEGLSFKCQRCKFIWRSRHLYPVWGNRPVEIYGKLPHLCPECKSEGWFRRKLWPREPTRGTQRKGKFGTVEVKSK